MTEQFGVIYKSIINMKLTSKQVVCFEEFITCECILVYCGTFVTGALKN